MCLSARTRQTERGRRPTLVMRLLPRKLTSSLLPFLSSLAALFLTRLYTNRLSSYPSIFLRLFGFPCLYVSDTSRARRFGIRGLVHPSIHYRVGEGERWRRRRRPFVVLVGMIRRSGWCCAKVEATQSVSSGGTPNKYGSDGRTWNIGVAGCFLLQ